MSSKIKQIDLFDMIEEVTNYSGIPEMTTLLGGQIFRHARNRVGVNVLFEYHPKIFEDVLRMMDWFSSQNRYAEAIQEKSVIRLYIGEYENVELERYMLLKPLGK